MKKTRNPALIAGIITLLPLCGCAIKVTLPDGATSSLSDGSDSITAANDRFSVDPDSSSNALDILGNDLLPAGRTVASIAVTANPSNGSLSVSGATLTYTPNPSYVGGDSFSYAVTDDLGKVSSANVTVKVLRPYTWKGDGADDKWSTADNWHGGVPGGSNTAIFDGTCSANCSPSIDAPASVGGILIEGAYAGTITQQPGITLSVGSTGWSQSTGTFLGSDAAVSISGPVALSGGAFRAPSGTLRLDRSFTVSNSPSFDANGGTVEFSGASTGGTITPAGLAFNHVSFSHDSSSKTLSGILTVNGNLAFNVAFVGVNGGEIHASGNVTVTNLNSGGSGSLIKLIGSANQAVSGVASKAIGSLEIAKSGGTATFSGTLAVARHFTYTSGSTDFGTSTVQFTGANTGGTISVPSTLAFNHVTFTHDSTSKALSGVMTVNGDLSFNVIFVNVNGGEIHAYGNVTVTNLTSNGSGALIKLAGSNNQTISGVAGKGIGSLEIAKSGGTATFTGTLAVSKNFTYTSGNADFSGSTLQFTGANTGGTISVPSTLNFNHVSFTHDSTGKSLSGVLTVLGNLSFGVAFVGVNNGEIHVHGDVTVTNLNSSNTSPALIKLVGAGNQLVSGTAAKPMGSLEIAKTGGTATMSGTLVVNRNYTYTSGTVDWGSSLLDIAGTSGGALSPNGLVHGNVRFSHNSNTKSMTGSLVVGGTLTVSTSNVWMTGGSISLAGDLVVTANPAVSDTHTRITLNGAADQSITHSAGYVPGTVLTINKATGNVNLLSALSLNKTGPNQHLTLTAGTVNMNNNNVTISGDLTNAAGTVINRGTGVLSVSGTTSGGGTIN